MSEQPIKNDGHFPPIWISERYYFDLNLVPQPNECNEPINRCALIDSENKEEVTAINFDSQWLIPIFQCRSQIGLKEFYAKLKEVANKNNIEITPRDKMPENKRIKETKHIGKSRQL